MPFSDPNGTVWEHHLKVEMSHGNLMAGPYFLEYLTLDLIDEFGNRPTVSHAEYATGPIHHIYWNWNFTLQEVTDMCCNTLPTQSDPEDVDPDLIGNVWYDDSAIEWVRTDE